MSESSDGKKSMLDLVADSFAEGVMKRIYGVKVEDLLTKTFGLTAERFKGSHVDYNSENGVVEVLIPSGFAKDDKQLIENVRQKRLPGITVETCKTHLTVTIPMQLLEEAKDPVYVVGEEIHTRATNGFDPGGEKNKS